MLVYLYKVCYSIRGGVSLNFKVKNMLYCSLFACITAILAQIKIDLPSLVPITMQTLGIYLIACLLKPRLALIASLVYLLMGTIGLPVFTNFNGGISTLLNATGGYIFSFPIMALVISLIVNQKDTLVIKIIAFLIGTAICYMIGTLWFMYVTNTSLWPALTMCVLPFIPGDLIKMVVAIILVNKLKNRI